MTRLISEEKKTVLGIRGRLIFWGEFSTGGKQHAARSWSESSAYCTWYLLIMVHVYKYWEGSTKFGGTVFWGIGLCNRGISLSLCLIWCSTDVLDWCSALTKIKISSDC